MLSDQMREVRRFPMKNESVAFLKCGTILLHMQRFILLKSNYATAHLHHIRITKHVHSIKKKNQLKNVWRQHRSPVISVIISGTKVTFLHASKTSGLSASDKISDLLT